MNKLADRFPPLATATLVAAGLAGLGGGWPLLTIGALAVAVVFGLRSATSR